MVPWIFLVLGANEEPNGWNANRQSRWQLRQSSYLTSVLFNCCNCFLACFWYINSNLWMEVLFPLEWSDQGTTYVSKEFHTKSDLGNQSRVMEIFHGDNSRSINATGINPLLETSQIQRLHWPGMTRGESTTWVERILKSNLWDSPVQWSLTTNETNIWTVTIKKKPIWHSISSRI